MTTDRFVQPARLRMTAVFAMLALCAACAGPRPSQDGPDLDFDLVSRAVSIATEMRAAGQRVWCVPFARNASGVEIRGNANTWWAKAKGVYDRGDRPVPGAVMSFSASGKLPRGHVAVVSRVLSDREILVHHANWERNKVSLDMPVIDVSPGNDWSEVRVRSQPTAFGSVYAVDGFISPGHILR